MQNEKTAEVVNAITNHVNTFSMKDDFNALMSMEHRTLQQSFTRLCLKWLEHAGSEAYKHDLRNQKTHEVAKQIVERFRKENNGFAPSEFLPYI